MCLVSVPLLLLVVGNAPTPAGSDPVGTLTAGFSSPFNPLSSLRASLVSIRGGDATLTAAEKVQPFYIFKMNFASFILLIE